MRAFHLFSVPGLILLSLVQLNCDLEWRSQMLPKCAAGVVFPVRSSAGVNTSLL